jgi:hypothetical protein
VRPRGEGDCPVRRVGASSTGQRGLGGVGTIAVMAQASAGERRTKIVATIGPASSTRGQLRGLIASGMDASRVNFAHGIARRTPTSSPACGLWPPGSVSPWLSFRTRRAPRSVWAPWPGGSVVLEAGQPFVLTTALVEGSRERASVSYAGLPGAVAAGTPSSSPRAPSSSASTGSAAARSGAG